MIVEAYRDPAKLDSAKYYRDGSPVFDAISPPVDTGVEEGKGDGRNLDSHDSCSCTNHDGPQKAPTLTPQAMEGRGQGRGRGRGVR